MLPCKGPSDDTFEMPWFLIFRCDCWADWWLWFKKFLDITNWLDATFSRFEIQFNWGDIEADSKLLVIRKDFSDLLVILCLLRLGILFDFMIRIRDKKHWFWLFILNRSLMDWCVLTVMQLQWQVTEISPQVVSFRRQISKEVDSWVEALLLVTS